MGRFDALFALVDGDTDAALVEALSVEGIGWNVPASLAPMLRSFRRLTTEIRKRAARRYLESLPTRVRQ